MKVLIVDEEEIVRDTLRDMLKESGVDEVEVAVDGVAALIQIREGSFNLILSSLMMIRMTGMELLQKVLKEDNKMPIIIMSGYSGATLPEELKQVGAKGFLAKPFALHELREAIAPYL